MSAIIKFIKKRGVKSGLGQTSNSIKMAAYIVAPLIAVWFIGQLLVPPGYQQVASAVEFIGWIAYILMLYSKVKADAAGYLPFPQSHWFFQDGQQVSYDLLVPPNGWEEIASYPDGSHAYRVLFKDRNEYQEADRPYPDIFDSAIWKTPANWTDSFNRTSHGEFFFENLFVDHPACENIALSVIFWDERGSRRTPVCLIHSCSYLYNMAKINEGKAFPTVNLPEADAKDLAIKDLKHKVFEVSTRNRYLEDEAEQYSKEGPEDIIELSDKRIEAFLKRHKSIMNAGKKSLLTRLLNGKYIFYAMILIAIFAVVGHFVFGWP